MKRAPTQERRGRGRPREFDREEALARALEVFWAHGYEGASIADLTGAMGITTPALYGAFTSKAELYREAAELYQARQSEAFWKAVEHEPTVRGALTVLMEGAARAFTDPRLPRGCMLSTAVLTCAEENQPIARFTASMRQGALERLQTLLGRGVETGELPATTDVVGLARFYGAITQGMSVQASDGASEEELMRIAAHALSRFPDGDGPRG